MKTIAEMKQRLLLSVILLISTFQLSAQGIVLNKTDGSKVYIPSQHIKSISTYGYDGEPNPNEVSNLNFTVKGVSFTMIYVAGGTFQMSYGCEVTLSGFYIGQTEVTQELWQAVMGNNPSNFKGTKLPVETVSWNDCQTFIAKLSTLTGKQFRLPTEAEWEFAASGGNNSHDYIYAGSNTVDNVAWYKDNSNNKTHNVGTKQSNELGIYDMSGNVWEWCSDFIWDSAYMKNMPTTNPTGPTSGDWHRVRGGSYRWEAEKAKVIAHDISDSPKSANNNLGLRLALWFFLSD